MTGVLFTNFLANPNPILHSIHKIRPTLTLFFPLLVKITLYVDKSWLELLKKLKNTLDECSFLFISFCGSLFDLLGVLD